MQPSALPPGQAGSQSCTDGRMRALIIQKTKQMHSLLQERDHACFLAQLREGSCWYCHVRGVRVLCLQWKHYNITEEVIVQGLHCSPCTCKLYSTHVVDLETADCLHLNDQIYPQGIIDLFFPFFFFV